MKKRYNEDRNGRMSKKEFLQSMGSVLRKWRKVKGWTLSNLSKRSGISLGYISQIELGRHSPTIDTLYRICLTLDRTMSELFDRTFPEKEWSPESDQQPD